jgi:hypothetical protein
VTLGLSVRVAWTQVADRRQEQEDRRLAQARLVTAWVDDARASRGLVAVVLVRNSSEQAVYSLTFALDVGVRGHYAKTRNALGPGETWRQEVHLAGSAWRTTGTGVAFTDAAGVDWIRTGIGQLRHPLDRDWSDYLSEGPGAFDTVEARDAGIKAHRERLKQGES